MTWTYFVCPRCGSVHDVDPRPYAAVSSNGQESGFSTRQSEFDSPHRYHATDLARIISHVRSIKRHVPPEFTADWKMLDEAADLLATIKEAS